MDNSNVCVVVPAHVAQKTKRLLKRLELWDGSRRLMAIPETGMVAIPIASKQNDPEKLLSLITQKISSEEEIDLQIKKMDLPTAKKLLVKSPETILIEGLTRLFEEDGLRLTDMLRSEVPDHWERHGDLVLLSDKTFASDQWKQFGDRLWLTVCKSLHCQRLARKSTVLQNGFRSPQVILLYGEDGWVEQIDNGIRYTYDVTRCMFSSGNITEKLRVAKFDCRGETVVDLYAGIGYFTLPYLLHTGVKHLHACEWNPDALEALQRNLWLNGVEDKCTVHFGDNRQVCPRNIADRVNLGLIPSSEPGWRTACAALKSSTVGILHIHGNVNTKTRYGERAVGDVLGRTDDTMNNATHSGTENSVLKDVNASSRTEHNEGAVGNKLDGYGVVEFNVNTKPKDHERALDYTSENVIDAGNVTTVVKDKTDACDEIIGKAVETEINVSMNSSNDCKLQVKNSIKHDHEASTENQTHSFINHTAETGFGDDTVTLKCKSFESNKTFMNGIEEVVSRRTGQVGENTAVKGLTIGTDDDLKVQSSHSKTADDIEDSLKTSVDNVEGRVKMGSALNTAVGNTEDNLKMQPPYNKTRNNIEGYVKMQSTHAKTVTATNTEENLESQSQPNTQAGNSKWLPWAKEVSERIRNILRDVHVSDWRTEILHIEHVKSYAPHVDHVVLDLKCSPVL